MKSLVVKRSVVIDGHKTSVSLEGPFGNGLKEIAHAERVTLSRLVAKIDAIREHGNLSSAIRLFVLDRVRTNGMSCVSHIPLVPPCVENHKEAKFLENCDLSHS